MASAPYETQELGVINGAVTIVEREHIIPCESGGFRVCVPLTAKQHYECAKAYWREVYGDYKFKDFDAEKMRINA